MFEIVIEVEACELTGLDALDWRRSHGMFDGVKVVIDPYAAKFPVDEAFARKWFTRSEVQASIRVGREELMACDVKVHRNYDWIVQVQITPERAGELFITSRERNRVLDYDDVLDFKTVPFTSDRVSGPVRLEHPRFQPGSISPVDHALERGGRT